MSVVDGKLKVYGVDGLRIADASIMPRVDRQHNGALRCDRRADGSPPVLRAQAKNSSLDAAFGTKEASSKCSNLAEQKFESILKTASRRSRFKQNEFHPEKALTYVCN